MSEHDEKRGGSGCAIGLVLAFLFLPVLYVLGVGPAAWLDFQFPQPSGVPLIRAIYAPLELAAEFQPIRDAIH
jgi:hypothetical protein